MRVSIFAACLAVLTFGCTSDPPGATPRRVDESKSDESKSSGANSDKANSGETESQADSHEPAPPVSDEISYEIGNAKRDCHRTLCVAGPGELTSQPNLDLGALCRRGYGVVRRCQGGRCMSLWPESEWRDGLDAMIDSLEGAESSCTIDLAGWSTGAAIASTELPAAIAADPRLGPGQRAVQNLVAMVPYVPKSKAKRLTLADNISKAFIYRHSKTPKGGDCSSEFEGGPWRSPKPVCGAETTCFDYDYSLDPLLAYLGRRGARSGPEIGHCVVASLVGKIGAANLWRGEETYSEFLPPYSDGSHGGRARSEGPPPPDFPEDPGAEDPGAEDPGAEAPPAAPAPAP